MNKKLLTVSAFLIAFGMSFSNSAFMNLMPQIWRVGPFGFPENLDGFCTLTTKPVLCSVQFPSAVKTTFGSSIYFQDPFLSRPYPSNRVYLITHD